MSGKFIEQRFEKTDKDFEMKKGKDVQLSKSEKFHEVYCPRCGQLVKKVRKKKEIDRQYFECKCSQLFSLTFPGIDESKERWLNGETEDDDRWTDLRIRWL